jgi:o-succinylbenzoate---CoA ligase
MTWFADERLVEVAGEDPDGPALADGDRTVAWAWLHARVAAVAARVVGAGVRPGARVALPGGASIEAVTALLGILRAGAVAAPIPAGLTPREVAAALDVIEPSLVLREGDLDPDGSWTFIEPDRRDRDPEAPAVIVLTSGTTGRPRGVVLSARAMAASADAWLAALPPATGWAMPLGLGHVAGLGILWRALREGVPVRLVRPTEPDALLAALRARDPVVSHVSLVPGQLVRLLDAAGDAPPPATLRAVLLGGGTIPELLVQRAARAGWPVVPTYGLSEMGSGVTALPSDEALTAPGTAGLPLTGVTLEIDEPGNDGVGEIVVTGPARSSGYLGEDPVPAGAPLHTGDVGRLDDAGRLIVVDRRMDRIVRGGENISPAEVEAVLEAHPGVAEAAVVARPDATWGQVSVAGVVLRGEPGDSGEPGGGRDPDGSGHPGDRELAAHARASLAGFKVPVAFTRLDALPRTPGGKLRREAVRALLAGEPAGELARPGGDAIGWRITGTGPRAVVLLHGTLSTAAQLDRFAGALAAPGDVTVHALDRRGSGSSRLADPRPLDIGVHVADLVAYLDARRIDRASFVGISFGGVLALEAAARHPQRVDAVVAWEPPYGAVADADTLAWFRRLAADTAQAHAERGAPGAAETFLRAVAGASSWDRLPERARAFLAREGDGALVDAGLTGLAPDGLGRIAVPVTILTGSASEPFYAPLADILATRIPDARRETLPGLAHPSPITQPGLVATAVRACLELSA